jgi:Ca2+-binding EF-hand superfamily protein
MDQLTQDQLMELQMSFMYHDRNNDGKLSYEEFDRLAKKIGLKCSESELKKLGKTFPLDFNSFLPIVAKSFKKAVEDVEEYFRQLDYHKSGLLDKRELRVMLANFGNIMSDEEYEAFFIRTDANQDGKISESELKRVLFQL